MKQKTALKKTLNYPSSNSHYYFKCHRKISTKRLYPFVIKNGTEKNYLTKNRCSLEDKKIQ